MAANTLAPAPAPSTSSFDNENAIDETDMDDSSSISQEKLLEKLGLGSVQHIALRSASMPSTENNGDEKSSEMTKVEDNTNNADCTPQLVSDTASSKDSRSSTPLSQVNGNCSPPLTKKEKRVGDQKLKVEDLKEELHCEETKLLLLKKILESQTNKRNVPAPRSREQLYSRSVHPSLHPKHSRPGGDTGKIQIAPKVILPQKNSVNGSNMPRVVPAVVSAANSKLTVHNQSYPNSTGSKTSSSTNVNSSQSSNSSVRKYYIQVGSQLVPAAPSSSAYPASSHYGGQTSHSHTPSVSSQRHSESPVDPQVSKQTAAKNALRRQLEQTLLQIPPPKPPPADWNTVPNVNSMDFMMLVGLDEIVDMILDLDGKPTMKGALLNMLPKSPLICDQCNVDFSPAWKAKPDSAAGVMLCERCAVSNVKKDLKAEHTSRLKSAFIKALKQEQDIEEKIKAGEDVSFALSERSENANMSSGSSYTQQQSNHGHQHSHQPSNQSDRHRQSVHRHHHQVVPHYPRHTSLVHQLHQQHLQQQQPQMEHESSGSHHSSNSRWHPYIPGSSHSHHNRIHTPAHGQSQQQSRRGYGTSSNGRQEYYVVHHPQHSNARWSR